MKWVLLDNNCIPVPSREVLFYSSNIGVFLGRNSHKEYDTDHSQIISSDGCTYNMKYFIKKTYWTYIELPIEIKKHIERINKG